jgi:hypothetical protein
MRHYEAAFGLWLVLPIALARLYLSNYSKVNGLVEIDDIDIYGEHIPSFMAKYAIICLSTFGIMTQVDFMCTPVYHSSTGFALITLEDFFFFIILLSILPSWNPKEEKHIESCQQVLNNFDNSLKTFVFEHEMTKEKFTVTYDELRAMVMEPCHKLGPIVTVSIGIFVVFVTLIVYTLFEEL